MNKLIAWFKIHKRHILPSLLLSVVAIAVVATHAWNMFDYPYYENDEATYVSRAWSVLNEGELDVYTYRYDHAPLGWIFISAWFALTGQEAIFGSLLESGRVFMLLIFAASAYMIFILTKHVTNGNTLAAVTATLLFAVSPLAIYFHRRILLDNIMTFWMLISLIMATQPKAKLKHYILSAVTFGVAVLTKLNAIFFLPAMLFIVWKQSHVTHRVHSLLYWLVISGLTIGSFFVYTLLKSEFFPAPLDSDGTPLRVSVIDTFALQLGRGDFAWPWQMESSFMQNVLSWGLLDWTILLVGAVSTIVLTFVGIRQYNKQPLIIAIVLMTWSMLLFLVRGKIVLNLYVVPLLPLIAISFGTLLHVIMSQKRVWKWARVGITALILAAISVTYTSLATHKAYSVNETSNQMSAVTWVRDNIPKDALITTDNYMYPYLAQESGFTNVSYFFATEYDPEVRQTYDDDWRNIEYLIVTHEVLEQVETGTVPNIKKILDHSTMIADFRKGTTSFIDLSKYISTNGDWVQVYKTKNRNDIVLQDSWTYFKFRYIESYGQVVNRDQNDITTSTDQSQAMIRAVREKDLDAFKGLWQWSKDHLQYRSADKLLSSVWARDSTGEYKTTETNASCDANQQFTYALHKANESWPKETFGDEAHIITRDWWRMCVLERDNSLYVAAFADGPDSLRPINMGVFYPEIHRYLATKTDTLPWGKLINDHYAILNTTLDQTGTVPNWRLLATNGDLLPAVSVIDATADAFGHNSLSLIERLIEDVARHDSGEARQILTRLEPSFAAYLAGGPGPQASMTKALFDQLFYADAAQESYEAAIAEPYQDSKGYWGNGRVYDEQFYLWKWHYAQPNIPNNLRVNLR